MAEAKATLPVLLIAYSYPCAKLEADRSGNVAWKALEERHASTDTSLYTKVKIHRLVGRLFT